MDKNWNVKVADFGLARGIEEKPGTMTACGTPTHAAPEVLRHSYYTKKADIYSFGICLWEMCTRKEPYDTIPGFRVILAVATKRMRPRIPPTLDSIWANLIRRCWSEVPEQRPDFNELVEILGNLDLPAPTNPYPFKDETPKESQTSSNNLPATVAKRRSSRSIALRIPSSDDEGEVNPKTPKNHTNDSNQSSQSEFTSKIGLVTELEPPPAQEYSSDRFSLTNSLLETVITTDTPKPNFTVQEASNDRL